jgi:A/G-specific adenine glycosylase
MKAHAKRGAAAPNAQWKPAQLQRFQRALLAWYDAHRRDLPWRRTRDPYRIWVSEIMLQQTRVAAVLDHYRNFFEHFPNVGALADATETAVLAAWSGLGYYRRARMMWRCAQEVARARGGRFPESAEELRALPGIGRYTAAAIASIAFAEHAAVVDGNVERVVGRLVGRPLSAAQTWERAQALLEPARPGDFNQAMMELGATVCLPRAPVCASCPVRSWCNTKGESRVAKRALPQAKKEEWFVLDQRRKQIRLVRRPAKSSLMPGMWELPPANRVERELLPAPSPQKSKLGRLDSHRVPRSGQAFHWRTFRHSITSTNYTVHVVRRHAGNRRSRGAWIAVSELPQTPLTGLTRKILRAASII